MFQNINPKQIEGVMKRMGISQTNLPAKRVIIEMEDLNIIIDDPSVTKIKMQGNESFQISGGIHEVLKENFDESDIKMVMEKTGTSKEDVYHFLKENNGDIALAILKLRK